MAAYLLPDKSILSYRKIYFIFKKYKNCIKSRECLRSSLKLLRLASLKQGLNWFEQSKT